MADRLRRFAYAVFVLAACGAATVGAQTRLADPTRPPAAFLGELADDASPDGGAEEGGGRVLQSVLIPAHGKPAAVIGGEQVRLGERFGDYRLIRLDEREAVVEGPEGIEHLLLTPDAVKSKSKKNIVEPTANRGSQRGSKRQ